MSGTIHRDYRDLVRIAERQGWEVSGGGSRHVKFKSPSGKQVTASATPSDVRAVRNLRSQLRRYGLTIANDCTGYTAPKHKRAS